MDNFKKTTLMFLAFLIFVLVTFDSAFVIGDESRIQPNEAYILLDTLFDLSPDKTSVQELLKRQNNWAKLYKKYSSKKTLSVNEMKVYLFIVFIADQQVISHTIEEVGKEIVSKFEKQPKEFLTVLGQNPFLMQSTCKAIQEHYILINEENNRFKFSAKYKNIIMQYLGEKQGAMCLKEINYLQE